jgi:hypothetical protein
MCRKIDAHCADRVNAEISSKKNKLRKNLFAEKSYEGRVVKKSHFLAQKTEKERERKMTEIK